MTNEELVRKIEKFCDVDVKANYRGEPIKWAGYQQALNDIFDIIFKERQARDAQIPQATEETEKETKAA